MKIAHMLATTTKKNFFEALKKMKTKRKISSNRMSLTKCDPHGVDIYSSLLQQCCMHFGIFAGAGLCKNLALELQSVPWFLTLKAFGPSLERVGLICKSYNNAPQMGGRSYRQRRFCEWIGKTSGFRMSSYGKFSVFRCGKRKAMGRCLGSG